MLHFAAKEGIGDINQAILTKIFGTRTNQSPQGFADIPVHDCRSLRARILAIRITCSSHM
jgi:hypothetical protein